MTCALLWLEGPLQSWGHDSMFGRRETLPFPTLSGILGMLCCALGKGGPQREWLAGMRNCDMLTLAYARQPSGIPRILADYHVVGAGYASNDPWQNLLSPKKSDGKRPTGTGGVRITHRFYLQDMAFAAILKLSEAQAAEIEQGLSNPVWPICLGRKCCVPSDLVWRGLFPARELAAARAREIADAKNRHEIFQVREGRLEGGETRFLADVPICFGPYKEYGEREVSIIETEQDLP